MKILVEKAVIEQALEALELMYEWLNAGTPSYVDESKEEAITAVREALAEPVRKCDGLLCNDCGEYKQRYKDLPGLTEKDLCVCSLAEQVEQEPFKMICPRCKVDRVTTQCPNRGGIGDCPMTATAQSAAPVKSICYQEAYDALEAQLIKEPTGNGLDQVAQNNGLIIAMNTLQKMNLAKQAEGAIVKTCPDGYGTITTEQAEQEPVMITPGGGAFPFAVVGEFEQAEQELVACIVRDCCEAEKADPDHSDTICIAVDDLTEIVTHHTTAPVQQAEQEPGAWMWACAECGTEAEDGTDCRICGSCGYHKFYKAPKVATCVCAAKTQEKVKQEPVAERFEKMHANGDVWITTIAAAAIARNAAPVRTKDLTDDEIMDLVRDECVDMRWPSTPLFIARAVIAKFKEKNRG